MKTILAHCAIIAALAVFVAAVPQHADAACTNPTPVNFGNFTQYRGNCTEDNEVLIDTGNVGSFDACVLMSSAGAVDVLLSLDGTTFATAALSLQDFGATTTDPVLVTTAGRVYGFRHKAMGVRVLQNGATDATVVMNCWRS
jgi:hypothetical protein